MTDLDDYSSRSYYFICQLSNICIAQNFHRSEKPDTVYSKNILIIKNITVASFLPL